MHDPTPDADVRLSLGPDGQLVDEARLRQTLEDHPQRRRALFAGRPIEGMVSAGSAHGPNGEFAARSVDELDAASQVR